MNLTVTARELVEALRANEARIVLAESCTGGLVAATLAQIPGVSECFCGSAVTYRNLTKIQWLEIDRETLDRYTAVSREVTRQMATSVLKRTSEASFSAAVTGHLGPEAPSDRDGVVFVTIAFRQGGKIDSETVRLQLKTDERPSRQQEAAEAVLKVARDHLRTQ